MPRSVSDLFYFFCCFHLHVCFLFFVVEKVSYCYVFSPFEKSSNLVSMKIRPTNVCLWKSTRTVLHSKYCFCSKDANQTGNTSSLLVHYLKQYPAINWSNGWTKNCIYECQGNRKQQQEKRDIQLAQKQTTINYLFARGTLYRSNYWHVEIWMGLQSSL